MPSSVVGGLALRKDARNCWPWVRSFTQAPLIWTNSPALIIAAWPTTVIRSRWPRALTRSTQNPFSGLWNVTRSTRPAKASVAVVWTKLATPSALRQNRLRLCSSYQRYGRPLEIGSRRGTSNTLRQTAELSRVKARIKALAEKTVSNGCTEAEAMAAAEMVGRLLERYALSMEEIDVREQRCVQVEVPIGGKRRRPIDACVTAIARFCDCKVWVSRDTVMPSYVFFGFDADTAMASYLFNCHRPCHGDCAHGISNGATSVAWRWSARCIEKFSARHGGSHRRSARSDASGT